MKAVVRPLLASAVLALAGISCASQPKLERPDLGVEVPPSWSTRVGAAEPPARWWRLLGGTRLDALVREALEHNHDLRAALARLEAAAAERRRIRGGALPQLDASFDASRTRQNFIGLPIPGREGGVLPARFTSFAAALTISWEVDVWGRVRAAQEAALAEEAAAFEDWEAARLSLAAQVAQAYFDAVEAERQLALAQATAGTFEASRDEVRRRYERGLRRTPLDVRLAEANLEAARAAIHLARERVDRARRSLEILLGRYPKGEVDTEDALDRALGAVPAGLPAQLLERRPDLRAAERRLAAAGARLKEARRALLPRIGLTASGGSSSSELRDLTNGDFGVWRLAANVLQPVFQGGRLLAGIDLARARQREALEAYVGRALAAFGEVEAALAAEDALARRVEALERAAKEAKAARELAEERYARGLEPLLTVLEAQRRAFDTERDLLSARRERIRNRIALHLALGGGFEGETRELSAVEEQTLAPQTAGDPEESP